MRQISDKEVTRLSTLIVGLQGLLERLESQGVNVSDKMRERIEECRKNHVCQKCGHPLVDVRDTRRGTMHQACYNEVNRWIKEGKMSEQQAVDKGIWNPTPDKPGRKGKYAEKAIARAAGKRKFGTNAGTGKP
jgi:hypothetical protein